MAEKSVKLISVFISEKQVDIKCVHQFISTGPRRSLIRFIFMLEVDDSAKDYCCQLMFCRDSVGLAGCSLISL